MAAWQGVSAARAAKSALSLVPWRGTRGGATLNWSHAPRNVFLVKNPGGARAAVVFDRVLANLAARPRVNVIVEDNGDVDVAHVAKVVGEERVFVAGTPTEMSQATDLVVSVGGDGTFFSAVGKFAAQRKVQGDDQLQDSATEAMHRHYVPPILGIACGTSKSVGSLINFSPQTFEAGLDTILERSIVDVAVRPRLMVTVSNRARERHFTIPYHCLNELLIERAQFRPIRVQCSRDGHVLTHAKGDGLIIATPCGSTAYSLSVGGPVVHPNTDSIVVTPVAPSYLGSHRAFILPIDKPLNVQPICTEPGQIVAVLDAQTSLDILPGDELVVERSPDDLLVISSVRGDNDHDWRSTLRKTQVLP